MIHSYISFTNKKYIVYTKQKTDTEQADGCQRGGGWGYMCMYMYVYVCMYVYL